VERLYWIWLDSKGGFTSVLYDAVSFSGYIASNGWVTGEYELEGNDSDLVEVLSRH
jgi:hypothetical protein